MIVARKADGMTQRDLGAALGLSPQSMNDIERGRWELPEKYYHLLPLEIRRAVVDIAVADLLDRAWQLGKLR